MSIGFTSRDIAQQLRRAWDDDVRDAEEVRFDRWRSRSIGHKLLDGAAFLLRREL